jgi:flagellar L-ring protein precursor FlgH
VRRIARRLLALVASVAASSAAAAPVLPSSSLFADHEGKRVGDVLTILIVETTQAEKSTVTKTKSGTQNAASGLGRLDFVDMWNLDAQNESLGEGSTARRGDLQARITVRITEIDPNGLLLVEGNRSVRVNGEEEKIVLRGAVRPEDVGPGNTVLSTFLADASIEYTGEGVLANAERPGLFTRLFNWLF